MWWAGVVEAAGNSAVVAVLGWRITATVRARFWPLVAFQIAALAWFASNVGYGLMFIGSDSGRWMWWDTWFDQASETVQQVAIITLPVAVLTLTGQLVRDYWAAARRITGGR